MTVGAVPDTDRAIAEASAGARLHLIADSFQRLTGKALVDTSRDPAGAMWDCRAAIVAHGTQADPVFFYGNRVALDLFGMDAEEFVRLPSRFSAEPLAREERARLLARVTAQNFIEDYSGIRIAKSGSRFRIAKATVWNLVDRHGAIHGQAACFADWEAVPAG